MSTQIAATKSQKTSKNEPELSIYQEYFQYTKQYKAQYGEKTVILMQVGAFFEIYGVKNSIVDAIEESNIVEVTDICQINISEKKANYGNGQIVMAGFRDFTIDKYLLKLTDNGYTIPVFVQEKNGKEITRVLSRVYSAGTYISCETDSSPQITNHIMCIWMETYGPMSTKTTIGSGGGAFQKTRDTIVYGVSVVNIFTGKSSIFQYETQFYMNMTTFDELERYVSIFSPSEVIIISPFDESKLKTIIQLTGLQPQIIHKIALNDTINKKQFDKVSKLTNHKYIRQILSTFFGEESYDVCSEFQIHNIATQSFCYLLDFIQEHNPDLVRKISIPEFNNTSSRMILANHTLSQLNIINDSNIDSKKSGQLSSVLSFLNKCCSSMGKRRFQYQLMNPTFDEEWLLGEYNMISALLTDNYYFIDMFRKQLAQIRDIEKICRQLVVKKVYPSSIYHLHKSVQNIQQINACLFEMPTVCQYLCNDFLDSREPGYYFIQSKCNIIIDFLDKHLFIDLCQPISSMTSFDANIIRPGVSVDLDATIMKYNEYNEQFNQIRTYFNVIMQKQENSPDTDYVKVHDTEKSGSCLQMTAKRSQILKTLLIKLAGNENMIKINNMIIPIADIKFTKASASNVEIEFTALNNLCKNILLCKESLNELIADTYISILTKLEVGLYVELENLASYVSKIDVLQAKVYVARQYNYCCPIIVSDAEKSFVNTRELRHCLIEYIQQNEIYVTNDIALGKSVTDGILLYGTNAVGKTSLIRALGVAVIMAQSGMFVPCTEFSYKPYTAIFSRILGNDNLFKGLSTFAVEMTELRIILKMADENSLILGDELCSGTETESALSIFIAGLMNLHKKQSSFIFATHFHEIVNYDEIVNMKCLSLKHMAVTYDREKECLIYDRKLKDGSGPKTYGLEVCKSLYLGDDFLEMAYGIRNKYFPESRGNLSHSPTVYNAAKIRGMCEMCGLKMGEETHHLSQQKDADENGFIGTFHKNHKANLLSVCQTCHDKIHSTPVQVVNNMSNNNNQPQIVRKKTTNGYKILH